MIFHRKIMIQYNEIINNTEFAGNRQWFAVQTHIMKEQAAKINFECQGFKVYLPMIKTVRRHARSVDLGALSTQRIAVEHRRPYVCRHGRVGFLTRGNAGSEFAWLGAGASWLPVAGDFGFVNPQ